MAKEAEKRKKENEKRRKKAKLVASTAVVVAQGLYPITIPTAPMKVKDSAANAMKFCRISAQTGSARDAKNTRTIIASAESSFMYAQAANRSRRTSQTMQMKAAVTRACLINVLFLKTFRINV